MIDSKFSDNAGEIQPAESVPTQLRRRRAASRRLPGGDPWPREAEAHRDQGFQGQPRKDLDAWQAAADHITAAGYAPITPLDVRRSLRERALTPDSKPRCAPMCENKAA